MSKRIAAVVVVVLAGAAAGAWVLTRSDDEPTRRDGPVVAVTSRAFPRQPEAAEVGVPVRFTNSDSVSHTFTSDTGLFHSGEIEPAGVFRFAFSRPGEYAYHCEIHPSMKGTITVR